MLDQDLVPVEDRVEAAALDAPHTRVNQILAVVGEEGGCLSGLHPERLAQRGENQLEGAVALAEGLGKIQVLYYYSFFDDACLPYFLYCGCFNRFCDLGV